LERTQRLQNRLVGANVIVLKGVVIGDRSIIGAGGVVALKNIPPDSVVAGNPAEIVKTVSPPRSLPD
jgi:acetyltransferase-like isoleucine patch superfamily enzyme